jgi:hypothetical protein
MARGKHGYSGIYNATPITLTDQEGAAHALDASGRVIMSASSGGSAPPTAIADGEKTVTTAGTDEALVGTSTPCREVTIMARTTNTGYIAVGTSGVDATLGTGDGIVLAPGDSFSFQISNLNLVYIDATVSGEGVRFTYTV